MMEKCEEGDSCDECEDIEECLYQKPRHTPEKINALIDMVRNSITPSKDKEQDD